MLENDAMLGTNLTELRQSSLSSIAAFLALIGYGWLMLVIWPITGGRAPVASFIGSALLIVGALVGLGRRESHWRWARLAVVLASLAAVGLALFEYQTMAIACLFILPITFASILINHNASFAVFVVVLAGTLLLTKSTAESRATTDVVLPLLVLGITTVASWLSGRNLHTALAWVWDGYDRAHRNELIAREGQAELRRALKALDEATHRLERANHMLSIARDQAEEARRLKQQFAQTISHELRTPLNLIVGFTDLMVQSPEYYGGRLLPAYARDLGIIHRNARHLQSLVNDVLDLARIEAAQMGIRPEKTEPHALVEDAVEATRSLVEVRGVALRREIEPNLPTLWVDEGRIRQVLLNLLSNAARFTDQGSITVRVRRDPDGVVFEVADTGVGIAQEEIGGLFEEFRQVNGSLRRARGGAGLGLSISKRFVELHGGTITVESEVGKGSTFRFVLPHLQQGPLEAGVEGLPVTHSSSPIATRRLGTVREPPLLLAVTHSPAAASLLLRYVHGCRTIAVRDLDDARQIALQSLPQGVVIDSSCYPIDCEELRRMSQDWGIPSTMFMACPLPGEEPLRLQVAADGYLIKPVSRDSLWDILRPYGDDVDSVLVVDDDPDFVRLMSRLLDSPVRRYRVLTAYSGGEALELCRHHQPDLLFLDMVLPDMGGSQVIQKLRADLATRDVPIVVVSAQEEVETSPPLSGTMVATRPSGLPVGEIVRWLQQMLEMPS